MDTVSDRACTARCFNVPGPVGVRELTVGKEVVRLQRPGQVERVHRVVVEARGRVEDGHVVAIGIRVDVGDQPVCVVLKLETGVR